MSRLTPEFAEEIISACQAGAEQAAAAFTTALGRQYTLAVGDPGTDFSNVLGEGPGLALLFTLDQEGLVAVLPESSGLLPEWYDTPDATGQRQLSKLAQELGKLLLPQDLVADSSQAARIDNCRVCLQRAGAAEGTSCLSLQLASGDDSGTVVLVWPLSNPTRLFEPDEERVEPEAPSPPAPPKPQVTTSRPTSFAHLPSYSRSLLKIKVPARVVLASKKEKVSDVVEMASGTIIKFDKACDEMLQLYVGNQLVAEGEAVKIGDKFGFRVNAMVMPQEHFSRVRGSQTA